MNEVKLKLNEGLLWESDWDGEDVGFPNVSVVGLYRLKDESVYFYIDTEKMKVLTAWNEEDYE